MIFQNSFHASHLSTLGNQSALRRIRQYRFDITGTERGSRARRTSVTIVSTVVRPISVHGAGLEGFFEISARDHLRNSSAIIE
jgi:hypothetical protein